MIDILSQIGVVECEMNSLKIAESKARKVEDIMDASGVTRYIYIQNIDNPIKMFRETAV